MFVNGHPIIVTNNPIEISVHVCSNIKGKKSCKDATSSQQTPERLNKKDAQVKTSRQDFVSINAHQSSEMNCEILPTATCQSSNGEKKTFASALSDAFYLPPHYRYQVS